MSIENRSKDLIEIVGTVENIIFKNIDNCYTVIDIFDEKGELVTAVGIMPYVQEGDTVLLAGKWTSHNSFGKQFSVEYFDRTLPSNDTDILHYLASGTVKGIGIKTAEKIVGKFGSDSFEVIEHHPEWLADFPGISMKKALEISMNFKEQFGVRNIMLLGHGEISAAMAIKIFKRYKMGAVNIIRENPYILCEEVGGISFDRCDSLACSLGFEADSPFRIQSGIQYLLNYNADKNGHTYLPREKLIEAASKLLEIKAELANEAIETLVTDKKLIKTYIEDTEAVYLAKYYYCEKYCAEKLGLLKRVTAGFSGYDKHLLIERAELESGIKYADMQVKAIENAIEHGVMILTGGPGTGKTTVIRAAIRIFEHLGQKVALAAPTGRAAKRMSDSTSCEAKTIHRLLEMDFQNGEELEFRRNETDPLDANVIIIDEASMLGIQLLQSLLKAIRPGTRLIFIGDSSQLPSVGAGNVLADLISSQRFCTVCLNEIFRQAKESLIVTNAHMINNGEYPELGAHDRDFFFLERRTDLQIAETVVELCANRLPKTYGLTAAEGIQIIAPTKNGASGTNQLNIDLQDKLNPPSPEKHEKRAHGSTFREGDKVMQIKNNYDVTWAKEGSTGNGIFNGDIGVITEIDEQRETVTISFDGRIADYDFSDLDEIEHAYAITVHKSQGSEYPIVIFPICNAVPMLLTRNLLYTAVTRAQKIVVLVGRREQIARMVDNNRQTSRYTGLSYLLNEAGA